MCGSCGWGALDVRPMPGDITRQDIERAAKNHGITPQEVLANVAESFPE